MWMSRTEDRTEPNNTGIIGRRNGDAIPDAVFGWSFMSDSPDKDHDRRTRGGR
jgi:hypothetical protein